MKINKRSSVFVFIIKARKASKASNQSLGTSPLSLPVPTHTIHSLRTRPIVVLPQPALAAQAIAARTYALKNTGRYRSDGFDLTNDTRTHVYGGVEAKKTMTNEIVRQTSGIAIY